MLNKKDMTKKYKIVVSGKGSEVYTHKIDQNIKDKLTDLNIESVDFDMEKIEEVQDIMLIDSVFDCDDIFLGPYNEPELYQIVVIDEDENTVWKSDDQHEFSDYQYEYKFETDSILLVDDYSKGVFYTYEIELEEDFNSEKLTPIITEIGERVEVITDLIYNGSDLTSHKEFGGYWSKGISFYLN